MAKVRPEKKKKMTKASLAALIVTIAILLGLVLSLVASGGFFVRAQEGASSENYKVNGSMMSYYTNSVYQSWYNQYYAYIYYGLMDFDPSKPLDEQYTDSTKKETYYDFFVAQAKEQVTKILKYCEAARVDKDVNFAEMEAEAEQYAKDSIKALKESAKSNNTDFTTFLRQNFGQYVNQKDLHDCLVLEHIASEYSTIVYDRIFDAMDDERKTEYFKDNLGTYITADYYAFTVSNKHTAESENPELKTPDKLGGKDSEQYKKAYAEAAAKAKEKNDALNALAKVLMENLSHAENKEAFEGYVREFKFDDAFDTAFAAAIKNWSETDKKTAEDAKEAYKAKIKEAVLKAANEGKDDVALEDLGLQKPEGDKKESKWEEAQRTLPKSVITELATVVKNLKKTTSYTLDTDFGKFLFGGVKAEYGIEYGENENKDGTNAKVNDYFRDDKTYSDSEKDAAEAEGKFSYTVNFVIESAHRDELVLRDVGHILFKVDTSAKENTNNTFKTKDEAKAAAEKLLEELKTKLGAITDDDKRKEEFEKVAEEKTADSGVFYENVHKDDNYVQEFKDWIFEAKTVGELGIIESSYGYHIMYYCGETDEAWRVSAHAGATSEDLTEWYEKLPYTVDINNDIFKTIFN